MLSTRRQFTDVASRRLGTQHIRLFDRKAEQVAADLVEGQRRTASLSQDRSDHFAVRIERHDAREVLYEILARRRREILNESVERSELAVFEPRRRYHEIPRSRRLLPEEEADEKERTASCLDRRERLFQFVDQLHSAANTTFVACIIRDASADVALPRGLFTSKRHSAGRRRARAHREGGRERS